MSDKTFELHFAGYPSPELVKTLFRAGPNSAVRESVRGKTSGAYSQAGSFQLSAAVRGLSLLCTKTVLASKCPTEEPPKMIGSQGTLAASLDYAVTKRPCWFTEMFGFEAGGRPLGQRLFTRTNPNRKHAGPVVVSINERALPATSIHIFWDGKELREPEQLRALLCLLTPLESSKEYTSQLRRLAA